MSNYYHKKKAKFTVARGGGSAANSTRSGRNMKAEFCVAIGRGVGQGREYNT